MVISSRVPTPMRKIGTSISVITEAEIEAHGNLSLVDVLRQMPAIGTSSNGGAGKPVSLRIRGEEGFRTLTIFDGIHLSDPSGTQVGPQLQHLLSSGVGRVEVLRGPQGLSYGADAGGIVNINSRRQEQGFAANFSAQAGQFDSRQTSANISAGNDRYNFFVSVADFETEGFNTRTADTVLNDNDGYENTTFHGRFSFNATDNLLFELVHRNVDGGSQFDGCFSGTTVHDCSADYKLSATRVSANYTSDNFSHSIAYATTDTDRENFALGVSSFTANGELNRLEYVGSATDLPGFDLVFGADFAEEVNNGNGRDNIGYYLEYLSDFSDNLFFTAGVRYDDNDDFGTNTSYRLTAAYLIDFDKDATLKFRSSYGTGFRAPSPFEISYNTGPFALPPASLVSLSQEKSKGFEVGVEYVLGNDLHLEAVYFDQEVGDAIFFDLAGFSGYLQDVGTSTSNGFELAGEFQLGKSWRLTANHTYNDTERPNGLQRIRRPQQLTNLGLSYFGLGDKLNVNAYYRISRDAIDEVFGAQVDLDDFEVLDVSANYSINDSLQIYARIENVMDEDYQEISGFNTAKSAAYIGFKLNFSSP